MNWFVELVEAHKDFADLVLKAVGLLLTSVGAVILAVKYFAEKAAARKSKELDLRRDAYFSYFAAIPQQIAAVASFFEPNRNPLTLPPDAQTSLHKLHLLAGRDALKIVIERNALFHKGVMDLAEIKAAGLNHQERLGHLVNEIVRLDQKISNTQDPERASAIKERAWVQQQIDELNPGRVQAWELFLKKYRSIVADLSINYVSLLPHARREIGLDGNIDDTLFSMEEDRVAALAEFEKKIPIIRRRFGLPLP